MLQVAVREYPPPMSLCLEGTLVEPLYICHAFHMLGIDALVGSLMFSLHLRLGITEIFSPQTVSSYTHSFLDDLEPNMLQRRCPWVSLYPFLCWFQGK